MCVHEKRRVCRAQVTGEQPPQRGAGGEGLKMCNVIHLSAAGRCVRLPRLLVRLIAGAPPVEAYRKREWWLFLSVALAVVRAMAVAECEFY